MIQQALVFLTNIHIWLQCLLLSFYILAFLLVVAVIISLHGPSPVVNDASVNLGADLPKTTGRVWIMWIILAAVNDKSVHRI